MTQVKNSVKGSGRYLNTAASKIQIAWFPATVEDKSRDWRIEGAWKVGLEFPDGTKQYYDSKATDRKIPAEKIVVLFFGNEITAPPLEVIDEESFSSSYIEDEECLFLLHVTIDAEVYLYRPEQKRFLRGDFYTSYQQFADDLQNKEGVIYHDMMVLVTPHLLRCFRLTYPVKDRRWEGQLWDEPYIFED
jgi:hypothetical protein